MPYYRDEAIVLRTHKLGEADHIVTLLTRAHGRVRAVAKGVRRTKSRFGSRLEPFTHIDVQLAEGRSLDVITQVVTLDSLANRVGSDYAAYTSGTVMLETAERLVVEDKEPAVQQYQLLLGALRALGAGEVAAAQLLDSYILRSLAVAGYAPSFDVCARCSAAGPHVAFHPGHGGMLCDRCRLPGSARPSVEVVEVLGGLLTGAWPRVTAAQPRALKEASGLVSAYLAWHLEHALKSLSMVQR